jgi:hypothetical protein
MIARIIGLFICALGAAITWKLGFETTLDVPSYVKYFFIVIGFAIVGAGWSLVRGLWGANMKQ